jgi:hypothetical protein
MTSTTARSDRTARSRIATAAAAVVAALLAVHMAMTFLYNVPPAADRSNTPPAFVDDYMSPLFVQDYKIFAPDPASADHQLWVRAWLVPPDGGEPETTDWVNVSAVEISSRTRRILRKQLTIVGAERMMAAWARLDEAQREVAGENYHRTGLDALREDLVAADPDGSPGDVDAFIRVTRFVDAYATQVAYALWGSPDTVRAVQTRVVYDPVVRWDDRNDPAARRPAATTVLTGWRPPLEYPGQDREAFARTFRSWFGA